MGRLIDADKLEYTCNADECGMLTGCNHCQYHIITKDEIDNAPTVEAIPKADHKTRLKADMVAMLTEIQLEILELKSYESADGQDLVMLADIGILFQQKINALKGGTEKGI